MSCSCVFSSATAKGPRHGPMPVKLFESGLNGPLNNIGEKLVKAELALFRDGWGQFKAVFSIAVYSPLGLRLFLSSVTNVSGPAAAMDATVRNLPSGILLWIWAQLTSVQWETSSTARSSNLSSDCPLSSKMSKCESAMSTRPAASMCSSPSTTPGWKGQYKTQDTLHTEKNQFLVKM